MPLAWTHDCDSLLDRIDGQQVSERDLRGAPPTDYPGHVARIRPLIPTDAMKKEMESLQSAQQVIIWDCVRYQEALDFPKSYNARVSVEYMNDTRAVRASGLQDLEWTS